MRSLSSIISTRRAGRLGSKHSATSGFTIVEALVAVAVLTTIIFAPMSIITQVLVQGALTENNLRANLLAQEVIEYVRYTRDTAVLDDNSSNWFSTLYSTDSSNPYISCIIDEGDWITDTHNDYCTPQCTTGGTTGDCGGTDMHLGFVDSVSRSDNGYGADREATCDGKSPKADGVFTTTLTIAVPSEESEIRYAVVESCVSWEDKIGEVRKVEYREAMFEWVLRE